MLVFLLLYKKHKKFTGEIALFYLGGYGLGRFWIEGLRTDQLIIGQTGIAMSQVVALLCVAAAVGIDIFMRVRIGAKKKEEH